MVIEQARPTGQSDDDEERRPRADDRTPDTSSDQEESAPAGQDPRQALQEQIGQVVQPVLDELQNQLAEVVRQQMEQALHPTGDEIEGEVDEASQPPPRQGRDQVEQTPQQPQREGPTEEGGRQLAAAGRGIAEQDDATPRSAGILGRVGAALQAMVTRLVNTLLGGLLQTVVSWLRRILVALREGLGSVVGKVAGAVTA
jgi:hypothetical protein